MVLYPVGVFLNSVIWEYALRLGNRLLRWSGNHTHGYGPTHSELPTGKIYEDADSMRVTHDLY